jgi:hypothetical protein
MIERRGRIVSVLIGVIVLFTSALITVFRHEPKNTAIEEPKPPVVLSEHAGSAYQALTKLDIKGRAPKTGYAREQFGAGWADVDNCDMRNYILQRDFATKQLDPKDNCTVLSGTLDDPYTGKTIQFKRGNGTSSAVQIDHVVALSDAWQKGAQSLDEGMRAEFANDPLNLLAVDGPANNKKSDGDAATWLPPNKDYRCRYVARQVAVKQKYNLWVTSTERDAIARVLESCPEQLLPTVP